mmetsp:Transcript_17846/g.49936  ORF Transcript_17846/g.49936 Transcript_17846/m.49936 type:complete len:278 (+) Transcript_17846:639-1472(+)
MIGGALALGLDQHQGIIDLAAELDERRKELQAVGLGVDDDAEVGSILGRGLEGVHAGVKALGWELVSERALQHELRAVGGHESVLGGVEGEVASDGKGSDQLRGGDKAVGGRVAVVPGGKVAVEGGDDAVGLALGNVGAFPLADAGTTGVGQNGSANSVEYIHDAVTFNGGADLLGAWADGEGDLGLDACVESLLGNGCSAGHVLVGGVCAGADEASLELRWPAVLLDVGGKLGDGVGEVGGEGPVDLGLQLAEVDLNELVVVGSLIRGQVGSEGIA